LSERQSCSPSGSRTYRSSIAAQAYASWLGLLIVAQNVLGSLANSHLFDFTHGWLYCIGVGIAAGSRHDKARRFIFSCRLAR
jgi:hypothetical protein